MLTAKIRRTTWTVTTFVSVRMCAQMPFLPHLAGHSVGRCLLVPLGSLAAVMLLGLCATLEVDRALGEQCF